MGIPRKGSRTVEIDGQDYVFIVREKNIEDHTDQWELQVTVQRDEERPGRVLQFTEGYGFAVTPEYIRTTVRDAIKAGWEPGSRGAAFRFGTGRSYRDSEPDDLG